MTPSAELVELLKKKDLRITYAIASNPSLSVENLDKLIKENLLDYYIMSGAVQHPHLSIANMERIVSLNRSDFKGEPEYELYQAQIWARLARRKDIPETLIHELATKKNPEHFLILALLESPVLSCDEKKRFLPQPNVVLENSIRQSMKAQKCQ